MTKTENLSLPQWVETDQIQRKDFNEAFSTLDENCADAVATAHSASDTAEAIAAVAYTPDNKPYTVGSYTGNGSEDWYSISVGYRPSFVLITHQGHSASSYIVDAIRVALIGENNSGSYNGKLTDTGFAVRVSEATPLPQLNISDMVYDYMTFR